MAKPTLSSAQTAVAGLGPDGDILVVGEVREGAGQGRCRAAHAASWRARARCSTTVAKSKAGAGGFEPCGAAAAGLAGGAAAAVGRDGRGQTRTQPGGGPFQEIPAKEHRPSETRTRGGGSVRTPGRRRPLVLPIAHNTRPRGEFSCSRGGTRRVAMPSALRPPSAAKPRRPDGRSRFEESRIMNGARRCLAVVLAAGEGTRMRSATPKVAAPARRAHHAGACRSRPWREARADAVVVVVGPGRDDVAAEARAAAPGRRDRRADRAPRHRPCGAGGARRDRARLRRRPGALRRRAADHAPTTLAGCGRGSPRAPGSWRWASRPPIRPATAGC